MDNRSDKQVREKLVARGVSALENDELLSLLLNVSGDRSAIEVAHAILEREGSLTALSEQKLGQLRMVEGIGMKSAATLAAAFELGRRVDAEEPVHTNVILDYNDVVRLFSPQLSRLEHEEMWVLYLNSANRIIEKRRIAQGGVDRLVVDCKLVVKKAVELLSHAIILVHNHPSGVAEPSQEDIALTERLSQAAELFSIPLLDHIIITRTNNYSFFKSGLLTIK